MRNFSLIVLGVFAPKAAISSDLGFWEIMNKDDSTTFDQLVEDSMDSTQSKSQDSINDVL